MDFILFFFWESKELACAFKEGLLKFIRNMMVGDIEKSNIFAGVSKLLGKMFGICCLIDI
jgi:hypothetical protein